MEDPLDLVKCGKKYKSKIGIFRFAMPIAKLCNEMEVYNLKKQEVEFFEKCILSLLKNISWWEYSVLIIPIENKINNAQSALNDGKVEFLAKSVVATTLKYSGSNSEYLCQGIEWACDAIRRYYPIVTSDKLPRINQDA